MKKTMILVAAIVAVAAIAIILFIASGQSRADTGVQNVTVGSIAPDYLFTAANGSIVNLSAYRGHLTVLWFVATWCPTCIQGNEVLNQNYQFFKQRGIKVIEVELYRDLGYNGPPISDFVISYAPAAYYNGTIVPAISGYNMTAAYDPKGYLDIYYVISSKGIVLYSNGEPSSTLGQLEHAINVSA